MRELIFILLVTGFCNSVLFGQNQSNKIYQKFKSADSVILVSHLTTHVPIIEEKINERVGIHQLVENGKVNYSIIKERYHLDKLEIDSIVSIIITPNRDNIIQDIGCFMPHHGILIFKKGKCSYFDICFDCRHFVTSKDIKLSDELDDETWNNLESFFRDRHLQYGMDENDSDPE